MPARRAAGRSGFTLVEVIVAIVVLGVGVLGVAATASLAARVLRQAEADEGAATAAAALLDSLLSRGVPAAGERVDGPYRLRWTTTASDTAAAEVRLTVEYRAAGTPRRLLLHALAVPPPRRLAPAQ